MALRRIEKKLTCRKKRRKKIRRQTNKIRRWLLKGMRGKSLEERKRRKKIRRQTN